MKKQLISIVFVFIAIFVNTAQANELTIPPKFQYQTINNAGDIVETSYKDTNLSRFYNYSEYKIKIYSDYNVTANARAHHVGILLQLDGKNTSLIQIQDSYIGHNLLVAVYDRSNNLLGLSEPKKINGNEIINTNLKIVTFENERYRFVYDKRDGRLQLDKADTNEIEAYIGNDSNSTMDKFIEIRDKNDSIYNRVGSTTSFRESLDVPSGDYFITIVTLEGKEITFPIFHLPPKKPLLRGEYYVPSYVTEDSIMVSVQGEAGTTIVVNGVDMGIMPENNISNITVNTSGIRGKKTLYFTLKDSLAKESVANKRGYTKITDVKNFILTPNIDMSVGESISTNSPDMNISEYGFDYGLKAKITYNDDASEFLDIRDIKLEISNKNILEQRFEARRGAFYSQKTAYLYALKEGAVTVVAKVGSLTSNSINIKIQGNPDKGVLFKDFGVTRLRYSSKSDLESKAVEVFGVNYRIAEWSDLKEFFDNGGNLLELFDNLALTELYDSAFIKKDGNLKNDKSNYIVQRREHNVYDFIEEIDNSFVSLRLQYFGYLPLMVIKKLDSDNDGISDIRERELGLNSNSNDSDGDGILDNVEIGDINNPIDTDNDGVIDALDEDSDNDGVSDKDERVAGTDPKDKNDYPKSGMSKQEMGLFVIMMNRSEQLNREDLTNEYVPKLNVPTILMIEAMKKQ